MTSNEYRRLHYWIERQLGIPMCCENCGTTDASRYEWSNLSGEYLEDISDWARLCVRCHRLIDGTVSNLEARIDPEVIARRAATKRKTHAARRLPCSVEGCEIPARGRGLCLKHYKHELYLESKI